MSPGEGVGLLEGDGMRAQSGVGDKGAGVRRSGERRRLLQRSGILCGATLGEFWEAK